MPGVHYGHPGRGPATVPVQSLLRQRRVHRARFVHGLRMRSHDHRLGGPSHQGARNPPQRTRTPLLPPVCGARMRGRRGASCRTLPRGGRSHDPFLPNARVARSAFLGDSGIRAGCHRPRQLRRGARGRHAVGVRRGRPGRKRRRGPALVAVRSRPDGRARRGGHGRRAHGADQWTYRDEPRGGFRLLHVSVVHYHRLHPRQHRGCLRESRPSVRHCGGRIPHGRADIGVGDGRAECGTGDVADHCAYCERHHNGAYGCSCGFREYELAYHCSYRCSVAGTDSRGRRRTDAVHGHSHPQHRVLPSHGNLQEKLR
mmetsp:Transcript_36909/g.71199  ORF Transcript_36909/g.71199 Transcript_36909/m.71199 type:complete len:314 (+) Transcript_36909:2583-3524(+)